MKSIGIISAGAMGTAIAHILAQNHHSVTLWDFMPNAVNEINSEHTNSPFLFGVHLHPSIAADTSLETVAQGKEALILATPSKYLPSVVRRLAVVPDIQDAKPKIAVLTKGFIEDDAGGPPLLITQAVEALLPPAYRNTLTVISGPSHAEEVARNKITGLICASKSAEHAAAFQRLLQSPSLWVFTSPDTEGVQVCGALKNAVAIAYGLLDSTIQLNERFGDNTRSFLFAAGLHEMQTLGMAMGSTHPETFTFLAGAGDLDVTCKSKYGRNRQFGREIITEKKLAPFADIEDLKQRISEIGYLPEGVFAVSAAVALAAQKGIRLPLISAVYRLLNKAITPKTFFDEIFNEHPPF